MTVSQVELFEQYLVCWNLLIAKPSHFSDHYCKADQKIKDIVPIAVGCALAALVVIVLIAYLIGRRWESQPFDRQK